MIYVVSSAHTYEFPHLELSIPVGLASGFRAAGLDAVVSWGGQPLSRDGVEHVPYAETKPRAEDILLIAYPGIAALDGEMAKYTNLRLPKRRMLFTSCDHANKDFSSFDVLLVEGPTAPVSAKYPKAKVVPCLMGAPEDIDIGSSPYTRPTVFFCGRFFAHPWSTMFQLALSLPGFDIALMSNYILPPNGRSILSVIPDTMSPELPGAWKLRLAQSSPHVIVSNTEAVAEVNQAIQRVSPHLSNLRYCGVRTWGAFWAWFHHAWCCLDFGFSSEPPAPNTKVIDPLRAGNRVVACGKSCTFKLVEAYGGRVVSLYDVAAMSNAIRSLPPETSEERLARAERYRSREGWNARMRSVTASLGDWLKA